MLIKSKRGETEVCVFAYFKNPQERKLVVEEIKKRRKSFVIYKLLPKKEKIKTQKRSWTNCHRKEILKAKGEKCEKCNAIENLEIHHKKYTNNLEDLEILCRKCHRKLDKKYSNEELGIGG